MNRYRLDGIAFDVKKQEIPKKDGMGSFKKTSFTLQHQRGKRTIYLKCESFDGKIYMQVSQGAHILLTNYCPLVNTWTDKTGQKVYSHVIMVDDFEFVSMTAQIPTPPPKGVYETFDTSNAIYTMEQGEIVEKETGVIVEKEIGDNNEQKETQNNW